MNTIQFLLQLILATVLTWGFAAFIFARWDVWTAGTNGKFGMVIALIILFIIVKAFTDPD